MVEEYSLKGLYGQVIFLLLEKGFGAFEFGSWFECGQANTRCAGDKD
jgi:hypothetical protein